MNFILKKLLPLLLLTAILAASLPSTASAASYVKGTNSASSSYKSSIYYERLTAVPLTGDGRTDTVAIALSQLGYQESDSADDFSGTVGGSKNFTEYNYNFGKYNDTDGYGYYWCAAFVAFCLLQAGCHNYTKLSDWCRNHKGDANYIWREISCIQWADQLRTTGYFEKSAYKGGTYTPIAGDLIFFVASGKTSESHIGIVLYATDTTVYTIEGNTSSASGVDANGGGVYVKSYAKTSSSISGYGVLPYKVNNNITRIDYSGGRVTPGLYVATTNKYVYKNEGDTSYTWLMPKYTQFTVTSVSSSSDRMKVSAVIDGKTVTGYVKNNGDRVIQLSSTASVTGYPSASESWGYLDSALDYYHLNSKQSASKPTTSALTVGDTLGISGWVGFTRKISAVGYYFDSSKASITWVSGALTDPESAVTTAGGANAKRYKILADTSKVSAGSHTVTYVAKLADGTVATIASLSYSAKNSAATPSAPTVESVTETSVTLKPISGYEYSINGGAFVSSNVFTGLSEDTVYSFTQRVAETSTSYASTTSAKTDVRTLKTPETTRPPETTAKPETTRPPETTAKPETTARPETTVAQGGTDASDRDPSPETTKKPSRPVVVTDPVTALPEAPVVPVPPTESEEAIDPSVTPDVGATEPDPEPPTDGSTGSAPAPIEGTSASPTENEESTSASASGCGMTVASPVLLLALLPAALLFKKRED